MENLSDYYSESDRDLLDLVTFHVDFLTKMEQAAQAAPDNREKIVLLESFRKLVDDRAKQRKQQYEDDLRQNDDFMQSRLNVDCPVCQATRPVEIIGEEKHDPLGYICDVVVCSVCGNEFLNHIPNNWDDRLKFFDYFIQEMLTVRDSGETLSEVVLSKEDSLAMVQWFKNLKEAHLEVIKRKADVDLAVKKADENLAAIHDYLLQAKLSVLNFNNPNASA